MLLLAMLAGAAAETEKVSSYDQGAKWSGKCIKVTDWNSKDADGDLDVQARDANGCCPAGYIPGASAYSIGSYVGAQVICGIASDGAMTGFSTSSSNGVSSCTYGDCYVVKQSTPCSDDTKILVNGCCGADATSAATTKFKDKCEKYLTKGTLAGEADVKTCKTYHKQYTLSGTSATTDDIAEEKLVLGSAVGGAGKYLYTPCADSGIPGVTSTGEAVGAAPAPAPAAASGAAGLAPCALTLLATLCLATLL